MDTIIKQEHEDNTIIQTIEIKPEPETDSEVIIKTVDLKIGKIHQQQPEDKQKSVQKRSSKKRILEDQHEDESTDVKIINITDINAHCSQPKEQKARKIAKRFKADNFDIQGIGRVIVGTEEICESSTGIRRVNDHAELKRSLESGTRSGFCGSELTFVSQTGTSMVNDDSEDGYGSQVDTRSRFDSSYLTYGSQMDTGGIDDHSELGNGSHEGTGSRTDGSQFSNGSQLDTYPNIAHIKTEKELIIEDSLPESDLSPSSALTVSISQDFNTKRHKTKRKSQKSTIIGQNCVDQAHDDQVDLHSKFELLNQVGLPSVKLNSQVDFSKNKLISQDDLPSVKLTKQVDYVGRKIKLASPVDYESQVDYENQPKPLQIAQKLDPFSLNHQGNHQIASIPPATYSSDLQYLQDFPSTSQTQVNPIYNTKSEFPSTIIKEDVQSDDPDDQSNDPDIKSDPTHLNPKTDPNDTDSDISATSNSNYKLQDGKFTCLTCNICFKILKNFNKHKCIICQQCSKQFSNRSGLKRHILHIHTATDEIFECKDCNKTFKAKKYLETHIKSHDKVLECDSCGMKFGSTSRLNEHQIKHKNPEILTCKVCDRKCSSRSSLKFHMRIHDIDRTKHLKCDKCSFTTDDNRTLVKHQKSHVKQEEKFKMSSEWLKCEKCSARLKNKQSLNNHMYYVHSEMSFQCNLCGIVVKTERNLKRHWKNIHENDNKS